MFNYNVDCIIVNVHCFGFKETADIRHKRGVEYPKWLIDENFELMYEVFVHSPRKVAQSGN